MARTADAFGPASGADVLLRPAIRAILVATLWSLPAGAARPPGPSNATCPNLFADGRAPILTNAKLAGRTLPLCFAAYAVLHSGTARVPLYAAERLTRSSVAAARQVERVDAFHDEERVPDDQRARLDDYVRSGFDRGHLAPAGDMPTGEAQAQSFSLANIVPQNRTFNRNLWASIEESTRRLASARGTLFVVTGPVFEGDSLAAINGRVLVPTRLFKAIYDPVRDEAGAYLAPNQADGAWRAVSIDALTGIAGLDVFPGLSAAVRASAMSLPEPHAFSLSEAAGRRSHGEETWQDWLGRAFARAVRRAYRDVLRAIF